MESDVYQLKTSEDDRTRFRQLSRLVIRSVDNRDYHLQRINIASRFHSSEPIQGSLADFFYGCWFDIAYDEHLAYSILDDAKSSLNFQVYTAFQRCINRQDYVERISQLATSWSVLVTPSMDVALHRIRTSTANTRSVVEKFIQQFLQAHEQGNKQAVEEIEQEFFNHCLVCNDLMAFMKVWFKLNKQGWTFDERWENCQKRLEVLKSNN